MSWDFSTEPDFQKKLDWVEEFCRDEIEPLDLVFPYAVRSKDPKIKALVKPLQDQVKAQGLWALFLDKDLGGPGYGQRKLGLLNEILGRYGSAQIEFEPAILREGVFGCPTRRLVPIKDQASPCEARAGSTDSATKAGGVAQGVDPGAHRHRAQGAVRRQIDDADGQMPVLPVRDAAEADRLGDALGGGKPE